MVVLLSILIAALIVCARWEKPVNLLYASEYDRLDSLESYAFVIQSEPRSTNRCERFEAEILARKDSTEWTAVYKKVLLYIHRDSSRALPQINDTILAQTRIRRGGSIGEFDYGTYLRRQGIVGSAYIYRYSSYPSTAHPVSLQQKLYRRLAQSGLNGDELATVGALTLGYKEDLDPALRHRFQRSGAAHVLAVSGLHTGIIYAILFGLITLGGRVRPRYENRWGRIGIGTAIIAIMWGYAWLTGMTPSVVRCVVMISLVEVGRMLYRHAPLMNTIAMAAVLILLVRPLDLWSISFQLSFAATVAIVIFAKDFEKAIPLDKRHKSGIKTILLWVVGLLTVSIAAQLGTLPITMYSFGQVSNYFLLTNLLVLPLATILVPCGLVTMLLGGSAVGKWVGTITNGLAWMINHTVEWIESLPGSANEVHINGWMVLLLYGAIGMGWLTMHRSLWWLGGVIGALTGFCILYTL